MARSSSTSRPSTAGSKETLSEKLRGNHPRRSSRKRLSLTSETSHTTTSSSGTPSNVVAPTSPQQHVDKEELHSTRNNDTENKAKSRKRRYSVGRDKKRDKANNTEQKSKSTSLGSDSSLNNFTDLSWDEDSHSPPPRSHPNSVKLTPTTESRTIRRESSRPRSSSSKKPVRGQDEADPTSRRSSSTSKPRRKSSSRQSPVPAPHSPRKRVSMADDGRSSSKGRRMSSNVSKPKLRRSLSGSESQSLKSFMQKEYSNRPEESEEALETKSAFTSISRSRNRKKNVQSSLDMNSTYHGESGHRNTRSFREMVAAKAAKNSRSLSKSNIGQPQVMGDEFDDASFRATLSEVITEDSMSAFDRSFSESLNASAQKMFQQGFANLPVLEEESNTTSKPTKPNVKKTRGRSIKKQGVSEQELSGFLDRCNEKRKKQEEKEARGKSLVSSPISGDRSCVSMPALHSSSKGKNRISSKICRSSRGSMSKLQESFRSSAVDDEEKLRKEAKAGNDGNPLVETLAEKGRRARSLSKSKSRLPKRQITRNKDPAKQHEQPTSRKDQRRSKSVEAPHRNQKSQERSASTKGHRRCQSVEAPAANLKPEEKSAPIKAQRRSQSVEALGRKKEDERTRSLSRTRPDSGKIEPHSSETLQKEYPAQSERTSGRARPPRGMKKLFSIRDLKSEAVVSLSTASLEFRRDDTSSAWALTSANQGQPLDQKDECPSPAGPTPDSSVYSETDEEGLVDLEAREEQDSFTSEVDVLGPDVKTPGEDSEVDDVLELVITDSTSVPEHGLDRHRACSENDSHRQTGSGLDSKARPEVSRLEIEEDVFSHYSWIKDVSTLGKETEETRKERLRLKEVIRESLLYSVFEEIFQS